MLRADVKIGCGIPGKLPESRDGLLTVRQCGRHLWRAPHRIRWKRSSRHGSVPVNGLNSLDIQQSPPAYVDAITAQDTDSLDWGVQQGFDNGTVTINVEDNGKTATVTVHASDITQVIDASMTCSTIVRSTP